MLWARCLGLALSLSITVSCAVSTPPIIRPLPSLQTIPSQVLPSVPMRFNLPDGSSLVARVWARPDPRQIILAVHGFNDYSKAFESLAQFLSAESGATTYAYDQRGFGANPQPGIWTGSDELVADLRNIATQLQERHPGLPLTVVGESMGGALVLIAAGESPGLVADQIILQAPAVWGAQSMPWYQRVSLKFMNAVAPEMTFTGRGPQALGITPTDDLEVLRNLGRDPFFIKATRVRSLAGVTELMGRAQSLRHPPPQRSLVLYGLRDSIIPPLPVCDWLTHLSANNASIPNLDVLIYPNGFHFLTRQLRGHDVLQDIREWLNQSPLPGRVSAQLARDLVCAR